MAEKNKVDRPQKTTKKTPANRSTDAGTKRKDKKVKVSSALRINVPISQSLLLILPSLARAGSANADSSNKSNDDSHNTAEPLNERHDESLLEGTHSPKTEQAISTENRLESLEASSNSQNKIGEAPQETIAANPTGGSHSSRYLSVASHPQVHYVPSVSAPVITNGHTQHSGTPTAGPTNTAQPTTFASVTFIAETIKGKYGELHVDESGKYVFVLDPHSPQYIALQELQHGTDPFTLHLSNGSTLVIQIPVTGHQDAPSVSGDLLGFVAEDNNVDANGFLQANGKIDVIDPDQNESSVTAETLTGQYGTLTIDAQGHWQYQAKNSSQEIQALVNQTSLHETFIIHTKDGTPQTLEMTIGGTDDNAVVSGSDTAVLTEGTHIQAQGKLDIQDPDAGQGHFQAGNFLGQLGSLVLTSQGNWTYQLDNTNPAVQALVQGKTATDRITVHSADGTPHQVTITVNGTNNAAIIGGVDTASISENTAGVNMSPDYAQPGIATLGNTTLYADGKLTITDPDTGESIFEKQGSNGYDYHGTYGDLILQNDGTWHYHADAGHRAAIGGVATTRGTAID
ncbi:VCBS domain-containing protein, partial [Vibrio genomosp. F10]|uniref:VCBS domain-containing protein n=1 Tax=Vibrio genomosp. F10 TaxID=723171 RepID=UPI0004748DC5